MPPADQRVGEQGEEHGGQGRADDHQHDRPEPQPPVLVAEVEVAVADGADRLDGEVEGVERRHPAPVRLPVAEQQHAPPTARPAPTSAPTASLMPPVEAAEHVAQPGCGVRRGRPRRAGADERRRRRRGRRAPAAQAGAVHLSAAADHDDRVAGRTARSRPGVDLDRRAVRGHDRDRGEVAVQVAQGAGAQHSVSATTNSSSPSRSVAPSGPQAGLDDRRRRQPGDVEHGDADVRRAPGRPRRCAAATTTRASGRSSRASSAVARVCRSSLSTQTRAVAPAEPGRVERLGQPGVAARYGTPRPGARRTSAGRAVVDDHAGAPAGCSCSTTRSPSSCSPQTTT